MRPKYHQYKMYTPANVYLGLLQNVVSSFGYNQLIATAFAQMDVQVAQSADVASLPNEAILDESGNPITDESGNSILIERQPDLVGSSNSNALIANNNLIKVYEYSSYYPNGLLVFSGYISKWKTNFGTTDDIAITCTSNGQDMNNYVVNSGDTAYISQLIDDGGAANFAIGVTSNKGAFDQVLQSFTVPATTPIGGIAVEATTSEAGSIQIFLYQMLGISPNLFTDTLLSSGSLHVGIITKTVEKVSLSSFPSVVVGPTYYFAALFSTDSGSFSEAAIFYTATNPYANGQLYTAQYDGSTLTTTAHSADDAYFVIYQHGGSVSGSYTNDDVSFIINDLITNYNSSGGLVTIPAGGYQSTGNIVSYTFKLQTVLQSLQALIQLAPANWYWYIDPALQTLVFAQSNTVADITLIAGRHISNLDIEATKENIKNVTYFTGGDDGTGTSTNIFVLRSSAVGGNRVGLSILSDNRVNSATGGTVTAALIASNNNAVNSSETYITTITVTDTTMDINLFKLGKMVAIKGLGNFADTLLLQVVGINRMGDQVILQLGTLPNRPTKAIAQIQNSLTSVQTLAIPSVPS